MFFDHLGDIALVLAVVAPFAAWAVQRHRLRVAPTASSEPSSLRVPGPRPAALFPLPTFEEHAAAANVGKEFLAAALANMDILALQNAQTVEALRRYAADLEAFASSALVDHDSGEAEIFHDASAQLTELLAATAPAANVDALAAVRAIALITTRNTEAINKLAKQLLSKREADALTELPRTVPITKDAKKK